MYLTVYTSLYIPHCIGRERERETEREREVSYKRGYLEVRRVQPVSQKEGRERDNNLRHDRQHRSSVHLRRPDL